ncbi:MAG TPA: hypothetical protein VFR11_17950 [Micromonosporaceae bacterium]|nr:hypothetical protein [Micromonosporaceae bacterium]
MQISYQFRRRRWAFILIVALVAVAGLGNIASGDRAVGWTVVAVAICYAALLPLALWSNTRRIARWYAKANSVPVGIAITDVDITFSSPWHQNSWAWFGIDTVADLRQVLIARCGDAPVFVIPVDCMAPNDAAELRAFLAQRGLLGRAVRRTKIAAADAPEPVAGPPAVRSSTPPPD